MAYTITVSENGQYVKLKIINWNRILHIICLFALKIFVQSISIKAVNPLQFCNFPSSNDTGIIVWLWDRMKSTLKPQKTQRKVLVILINRDHFSQGTGCLRFKCRKFLIVLTTWMDLKTQTN